MDPHTELLRQRQLYAARMQQTPDIRVHAVKSPKQIVSDYWWPGIVEAIKIKWNTERGY